MHGVDEELRTPLHLAVGAGSFPCVNELLLRGARCKQAGDEQESAELELFSHRQAHKPAMRSQESLTAVSRAGAKIDTVDECGWTPIHSAASVGDVEVVVPRIHASSRSNARTTSFASALSLDSFMNRASDMQWWSSLAFMPHSTPRVKRKGQCHLHPPFPLTLSFVLSDVQVFRRLMQAAQELGALE